MLVGDVTFDVTLRDRNHKEELSVGLRTKTGVCVCVCMYAHHVDEVGEDTLHLVDIDILQLHHPQSHQEGVQRQLVRPQQQIPAETRQLRSSRRRRDMSQ